MVSANEVMDKSKLYAEIARSMFCTRWGIPSFVVKKYFIKLRRMTNKQHWLIKIPDVPESACLERMRIIKMVSKTASEKKYFRLYHSILLRLFDFFCHACKERMRSHRSTPEIISASHTLFQTNLLKSITGGFQHGFRSNPVNGTVLLRPTEW